jgi:hypothetical protein
MLWGATAIGASYDVLQTWQQEAAEVRGQALDGGPSWLRSGRKVATELTAFLTSSVGG